MMSGGVLRVRLALSGLAIAGLLCAVATEASGQVGDIPADTQMRFGPLTFNPGLVLSSGYDTNPWRESLSDTTAIEDVIETYATPQVDGWLQAGNLRAELFGAMEVVTAGEGPVSRNHQLGVNAAWEGGRIVPYGQFTSRHTNANPTGFEVGRKSMRIEHDIKTGVSLKMGSATRISSFYRRTQTNWDADAIYQTSSLREKLNRTDDGLGGSIDIALTPLTSVRATGERTSSAFLFSPARNGSGGLFTGGASFEGPATIVGNVDIGVRTFKSTLSNVSFRGLYANVSATHSLPTNTVLAFRFSRDLQFSYDTSLAYFQGQSIEFTVIQPLGERMGMQINVGRHTLLYDQATSSTTPLNAVSEVGVAIGRSITRRTRIGVSVERGSAKGNQAWQSFRVISFLTYGTGRFQRLDRPIPFQR
jgi:hypothetical protein